MALIALIFNIHYLLEVSQPKAQICGISTYISSFSPKSKANITNQTTDHDNDITLTYICTHLIHTTIFICYIQTTWKNNTTNPEPLPFLLFHI